ncbi:transposase [Mycolicibacterium conceptionense]|uniref:IS607 family element RNA-guided endonuclease TnpB n=1 Tax=Mycolicibacterium conceptionense TaxID=451644 RepID=UPI0007E9B4EC|nr:IS607 family element RNA-guided endonuclease TnpB [Mycolicibacterium conceptionense]OBB14673.1 transposase [Mycolicibacterium conceptionense]OBF03405.1 transposase [Mycolicibacterium conceptionense]
MRAYRFALDPTPAQEQQLRSHCGAARFAYNHMLALVKANLEQRAAERTYDIPDQELTPPVSWSFYSLRNQWNQIKSDVAPWWSENSKEAYANGIANLAAALSNWSTSRAGQRRGRTVRFPRFKTKRARPSCRFTTGGLGLVERDRRHIRLPKIGIIRTHESTRKLARRVEAGTARIRSAAISFERGRWHVAFSVELLAGSTQRHSRHLRAVVGVDLGITHLAVLSTPVQGLSDEHGMVANPDHLERAQKQLRRLQRQVARRRGRDKHTGATPSAHWLQTQTQINRLHAHIANARADGLHKLSTALAARFETIVVEDLNVTGMLANHRLARRIGGAGWGELRRQLTYKTNDRGGTLIVADRFYPSSKTCSNCGAVKAKLSLSQRIYHCESCSIRIDRDRNAAANLAALAANVTGTSSPSCGATQNEPTGNPHKTSTAGSRYRHGKSHEDNVA